TMGRPRDGLKKLRSRAMDQPKSTLAFYISRKMRPREAPRWRYFGLVELQSKELFQPLRNLVKCIKRRKVYLRILFKRTCGSTWLQPMERRRAPKSVIPSP